MGDVEERERDTDTDRQVQNWMRVQFTIVCNLLDAFQCVQFTSECKLHNKISIFAESMCSLHASKNTSSQSGVSGELLVVLPSI